MKNVRLSIVLLSSLALYITGGGYSPLRAEVCFIIGGCNKSGTPQQSVNDCTSLGYYSACETGYRKDTSDTCTNKGVTYYKCVADCSTLYFKQNDCKKKLGLNGSEQYCRKVTNKPCDNGTWWELITGSCPIDFDNMSSVEKYLPRNLFAGVADVFNAVFGVNEAAAQAVTGMTHGTHNPGNNITPANPNPDIPVIPTWEEPEIIDYPCSHYGEYTFQEAVNRVPADFKECSKNNSCYIVTPKGDHFAYGQQCYKAPLTVHCSSGYTTAEPDDNTFSVVQENGKECYRIQGCNKQNGWMLPKDVTLVGEPFTWETQTVSSQTCYKATGCNNDKGWFNAKPGNAFAYKWNSASSLTCYKATGCTGGWLQDTQIDESIFTYDEQIYAENTPAAKKCYKANGCSCLWGGSKDAQNSAVKTSGSQTCYSGGCTVKTNKNGNIMYCDECKNLRQCSSSMLAHGNDSHSNVMELLQ